MNEKRVQLKELLNLQEKYITHDTVRCINTNGAIDLDSVEQFMQVDGESSVSEAAADRIKSFVTKYPEWRVIVPYEGYTLYFFSTQPKVVDIREQVSLHRGACGVLKGAPKNCLIILDMD